MSGETTRRIGPAEADGENGEDGCGWEHGPAYLPAWLMADDRLTARQKVLTGRIWSLSKRDGYCYARDAYFAWMLGVSERTVRRDLDAVLSAGHVRAEHRYFGMGGSQRLLRPVVQEEARLDAGDQPDGRPDRDDQPDGRLAI